MGLFAQWAVMECRKIAQQPTGGNLSLLFKVAVKRRLGVIASTSEGDLFL